MKCHKRLLPNPSRRNFLFYTSMSTCLLFLDPMRRTDPAWASTGKDYYLSNSEKFTAEFEKTLKAAEHYLKSKGQRDEICNFRYKKGRAVTQDWSTETPRFKG